MSGDVQKPAQHDPSPKPEPLPRNELFAKGIDISKSIY